MQHVPATSGGAGARPARLLLSDVSKTFPGTRALDRVDLEVAPGEVHALIGHNGSGKSTLVKVLAGFHTADPGYQAAMDGVPVILGEQLGLRFVHQNSALVEALSVADNFRLTTCSSGLARLDRRAEGELAAAALAELGYDIHPGTPVAMLSASERTAVAVARALDGWRDSARLLVLDEVTASLPGPEVARLLDALRKVRASGVSILFVSHHLDEVLALADRVTVLRDGRRVATEPAADLTHGRLVELMLGRSVQTTSVAPRPRTATDVGRALLSVRELGGHVLRSLDLDVAAGEIVGIAGLTGSGREEVAALLGGRLPRLGTVSVGAAELPSASPAAALALGLCTLSADRAGHALLHAGSIRENLTLPDLSPFWRRGWLGRRAERSETTDWIDRLNVRSRGSETPIGTLSGGNQQKVVMARWLRLGPRVLVLDEPTQGVDVGAKAEIHALIRSAAASGAAVIVCSTDDDELAQLASRVVVLHRGDQTAELTGSDLTAQHLESLQLLAHA